jgi:prevent-host-death family protein
MMVGIEEVTCRLSGRGDPAMRIASVADVKSKFSAYLKATEAGPVVVTRNGKPVAVLLGVQDEEEIERLLMAYSPQLRAILDQSRQQISEGRKLGHQEFWADLETAETSDSQPPRRRKGEK